MNASIPPAIILSRMNCPSIHRWNEMSIHPSMEWTVHPSIDWMNCPSIHRLIEMSIHPLVVRFLPSLQQSLEWIVRPSISWMNCPFNSQSYDSSIPLPSVRRMNHPSTIPSIQSQSSCRSCQSGTLLEVSQLAGALSPVNHKGSHQGWKQTWIYLPEETTCDRQKQPGPGESELLG